MKTETLHFHVTVKIEYDENERGARNERIKDARELMLSSAISGTGGMVLPKKATLMKPEPKSYH